MTKEKVYVTPPSMDSGAHNPPSPKPDVVHPKLIETGQGTP